MSGVGMPAWLHLCLFGRMVEDAFGEEPYLVGSAARSKEWRDVDVRVMLDESDFRRLLGDPIRPHWTMPAWCAVCAAFSALGERMTGLPVDFQIQIRDDANERYGGQPRECLTIRLGGAA